MRSILDICCEWLGWIRKGPKWWIFNVALKAKLWNKWKSIMNVVCTNKNACCILKNSDSKKRTGFYIRDNIRYDRCFNLEQIASHLVIIDIYCENGRKRNYSRPGKPSAVSAFFWCIFGYGYGYSYGFGWLWIWLFSYSYLGYSYNCFKGSFIFCVLL